MMKKKTKYFLLTLGTFLCVNCSAFNQVFAQVVPPSSTNIPLLPSGYTLQQVHLKDSSVIGQEEIQEIAAPYIGRNVTFQDLRKIQIQLAKLYEKAGYLNSFVQILSEDNQQLQAGKGIVVYRAVESKLEKIEVEGLSHLQENYVRERLSPYASSPLNIKSLEDGLLLLKEDNLISQVDSTIVPGELDGASLWTVKVKEAPVWKVAAESSNEESPLVGEWGWDVTLENKNIWGFGDRAQIEYKQTEGLERFLTSVSLPVNSDNGTVQLSYQ